MRRLLNPVTVAAAVVLSAGAYVSAQTDFNWNGQLAPGQSIEIKGINGEIRAVAGGGSDIVVTAVKSARLSNPAGVRIDAVSHAGGVTVCAIYPSPNGEPANECEAGGAGRSNTRDNDTVVDFTVRVPAGINFIGRTINGSVDADGLQGAVESYTVNGSIKVSTTGSVRANTVNGSIDAAMGRVDSSSNTVFKTVNGEITLRLPASANADVHLASVNGRIRSDFPLTVTGLLEPGPRRLDGTLGNGGQKLDASTVNGSVSLLKR